MVVAVGDSSWTEPRWSPAGNLLAFHARRFCDYDDEGGEVWESRVSVLNLTTGGRSWTGTARESHSDFRWSPRGTHLVVRMYLGRSESGLYVTNLTGTTRTRVVENGALQDW